MKGRRAEKKLAVETYVKQYLDSFPPEYKENPENLKQIEENIKRYLYYIVEKEHNVIDFDTFLSDEYQASIKRIDEKNKNPVPKLTKEEERERVKAEMKAAKDKLKAEEKAIKDNLKAEEKAALRNVKERLKAEEKEAKDKAKALKAQEKDEKKKKGKGQEDASSSDSDSDSSYFSSSSDSDSDDIPSYLKNGGADSAEKKKNKKVAIVEEEELLDELDEFYDNESENEEGEGDKINKTGYIEGYKDTDALDRTIDELEGDEVLLQMAESGNSKNPNYKTMIAESLDFLKKYKHKYLSLDALRKYSPKFLTMIENIEDPDHPGLHLVYSQFRSMEGIGIFALSLEANGYAQFKIARTSVGWDLVTSDEDMGKPHYALYTGTEDAEEREIIRNIYNGDWNYIPNNIASKLKTISNNNNMGEIIKVLMITSAGSEGINLRNTRYVHIMEPYWHPVRLEQVIGRARRICSHQSLPLELRTVDVFIYLMVLTQEQIDGEFGIELKLKDRSNLPPYLPQTSDEKLFEISTIKENLTDQITKAIKSSSIDCITHTKSNMKEGIVCLSFGDPPNTKFSYNPNLEQDQNDTIANINMEVNNWKVKEILIESTGKKYMLRLDTNDLYDYDSIIQAIKIPGIRPILLGKLAKNEEGEYQIVKRKI